MWRNISQFFLAIFIMLFNDFIINLAPIILVILPLLFIPFYLIWGRKLHASAEDRESVMNYQEADAITDKHLLWQSLFVLALVIIGFVLAHDLNQQPDEVLLHLPTPILAAEQRRPSEPDAVFGGHQTVSRASGFDSAKLNERR